MTITRQEVEGLAIGDLIEVTVADLQQGVVKTVTGPAKGLPGRLEEHKRCLYVGGLQIRSRTGEPPSDPMMLLRVLATDRG